MVAPEAPESISIEEAQKWFHDVYLPNIPLSKPAGAGKSHHRKAAWQRALKPKNAKNKEFIWVPVDYEGAGRPGVILYDEDTLYRLELDKYFIQPILEGLIVLKAGQQVQAFLAQIAYDPFALAANGYKLEKSTFTGTLLRADWHDHLIDGTAFHKGEMVKGFVKAPDGVVKPANATVKNARMSDCFYYYVEYQTTYVGDDGIVGVVGHQSWATVCDGSGNGGWGDGSGGFDSYGDLGSGGSFTYGDTGGGTYYDPLLNSGAGGWVYPTNILFNYDINKAIAADGTDRLNMNANLTKVLYAVGLGTSISGWSLDKATALARSIGASVDQFFPLASNTVRKIGAAGLIISGTQLYLGVSDNGFQWDEDGWNLAQTALAIPGVLAISAAAPWVVVVTGAVSIGIAIYKAP
jgi:hypothetical protein